MFLINVASPIDVSDTCRKSRVFEMKSDVIAIGNNTKANLNVGNKDIIREQKVKSKNIAMSVVKVVW